MGYESIDHEAKGCISNSPLVGLYLSMKVYIVFNNRAARDARTFLCRALQNREMILNVLTHVTSNDTRELEQQRRERQQKVT